MKRACSMTSKVKCTCFALENICRFVPHVKIPILLYMDRKKLAIINAVLLVIVLFLGYTLYNIIQEPIQFNRIKERRYAAVITRLEQIRDAQQAYKGEYGFYAEDTNKLVSFVDTGHVTIKLRKDSTFQYYNKLYQQDMMKDTVVVRVLGRKPASEEIFGEGFEAASLAVVPFNDQRGFTMGTGTINKNNIDIAVFEVKVGDTTIFEDVFSRYKDYIQDKSHALQIGSLEEPTLSGNWK